MRSSSYQGGSPLTAMIVNITHTVATMMKMTFAIGGASLIASGTLRVSKQTYYHIIAIFISTNIEMYTNKYLFIQL
jgi:hypothetical protein